MKEKTFEASCPNCKQRFRWQRSSPYRPFCSERCRLIDLGAWLDGEYRLEDDAENTAHREWAEK